MSHLNVIIKNIAFLPQPDAVANCTFENAFSARPIIFFLKKVLSIYTISIQTNIHILFNIYKSIIAITHNLIKHIIRSTFTLTQHSKKGLIRGK